VWQRVEFKFASLVQQATSLHASACSNDCCLVTDSSPRKTACSRLRLVGLCFSSVGRAPTWTTARPWVCNNLSKDLRGADSRTCHQDHSNSIAGDGLFRQWNHGVVWICFDCTVRPMEISPHSIWLDTSRLYTIRHVRRVERVETSVSSRAVRQARHGQNPKVHGLDTWNVSCRVETWWTKWNLCYTLTYYMLIYIL